MARHKELGVVNIAGNPTKVYLRMDGEHMIFWARVGEIVVESKDPTTLAKQAEEVASALANAVFTPARLVRITNKLSGISIECIEVQTATVGTYNLMKVHDNIRKLETGMIADNLYQAVKPSDYLPDTDALDEAFRGLVEAVQ